MGRQGIDQEWSAAIFDGISHVATELAHTTPPLAASKPNRAAISAGLFGGNEGKMYCIRLDIPQNLCDINEVLKAIYHGKDSICIWVFKASDERNRFVDETAGMMKSGRETHYEKYYAWDL